MRNRPSQTKQAPGRRLERSRQTELSEEFLLANFFDAQRFCLGDFRRTWVLAGDEPVRLL